MSVPGVRPGKAKTRPPSAGRAAGSAKSPGPPRIYVRRNEPTSSRGSGLRLAAGIVFALLCVAVVSAYATRDRVEAHDPHYLWARAALDDYQRGRLERERNYAAPVYEDVLSELALVDERSISAEPANQLRTELEALIRAWRDRSRAKHLATRERSRRPHDQNTIFFEIQQQSRLNPVTQYPECENHDRAGNDE